MWDPTCFYVLYIDISIYIYFFCNNIWVGMRLGDPPKMVCQNGMTKKKGME